MRGAGGLARRHDLVVRLRVPAAEEQRTVQHDVDLVGAELHDLGDLAEPGVERAEPGRERAGDARHVHARVLRAASAATGTSCGYRQTAATDGIDGSTGSGRTAFAHSATILPTVSVPSSVVRSMQRIARSSAQSLEDFLIERLASDAARSSSPTASTATVAWR